MQRRTTGEALTAAMDEKGVSVRELRRRTGLSITSIRRLRRGDMDGNLYTWAQIADALGTTLDELVRG